MSFPKTLKAAKAECFGVVAEGDATTQAGFLLSEQDLRNIEETTAAAETTNANLTKQVGDITKERDDAKAAQTAAETNATGLTSQITALTKERDDALALAKQFGANTEEPAATEKNADDFKNKPNATVKSSMEQYYESVHGHSRV